MPKRMAKFITKEGINTEAIADLESKKKLVVEALLKSGVDRAELAAVTVLALLDRVPEKPTGQVVAAVDATADLAQVRRTIDRSIALNLAATAMVGAAL